MRPILTTSLVFALCTSIVHADLRYTTRVDVRRTASAAAEPVPGELAAALNTLMPPGETRIFVRADAMRLEQAVGARPTVVLIRPDGQFVLYPDLQRYVRMPLPGSPVLPDRTRAPSVRRSGEFATILGLRAERIFVSMALALPITPPAGFPTTMTLEGELWLSDAYGAEAVGLRTLMGPVPIAPDGLEGMVLRQVLRNAQLGYEIETQVTELVEGPVSAELFEIPAGYRPVEKPVMPDPPRGGRR